MANQLIIDARVLHNGTWLSEGRGVMCRYPSKCFIIKQIRHRVIYFSSGSFELF